MPGVRANRRSQSLAFVAAWLVCMLLGATTAAAQATAPADSPRLETGDRELIETLDRVGLLQDWIDTAPVSRESALLHVTSGTAYADARQTLIVGAEALVERHTDIEGRADRLDQIDDQIDALDALIRDVRRDITTHGRTTAVSLTVGRVSQARLTIGLLSARATGHGASLDSIAIAENRLATARHQLRREIDQLMRRRDRLSKSGDIVISRLTSLQEELGEISSLVQTGRQRDVAGQFELMGERAALVELMAPLHEQRTLGTTQIAGLTLVTIDAYVQAAANLDSSCPVDWAMLAGIGRVESRHGTLDSATVQPSGRVTTSIFGPLLDGGATEREAAEAAEAAEAEALLAELEALALAEAEAAYDPAVWGEETLLRAEEIALEAEGNTEPVGLAALPEEVEEPADEDEDEEEEDEPEGNGFAVIEDTDGGALDGNERWDRAVGPMQFIPETWSYWKTDGNGDGVIDPQNLYDAAASAGHMLCSLSRSRGASPSTFILGYNSSRTYVRNVLSFADAYGALPLPT